MADASAPRTLDVRDAHHQLFAHPLYTALTNARQLQIFMRSHVYCVWDFQCLLKGLQRYVTCVDVPWLPTVDPGARRLVNEIVLDEESDVAPGGGHLSHFELYLRAMQEAGADTEPVLGFVQRLREGATVAEALAHSSTPPGVAGFVGKTLDVAMSGSGHRIAAAFTYGREEVIPDMFRQVVAQLADAEPSRWGTFRYYLDRHIEHDEDVHAPAARALVARICGSDEALWAQAEATARSALQARIDLWQALYSDLQRA